jgi:Tfp pilus assembly protein PilX
MDKKGSVLIFGLLVVTVLSVLTTSFFYKSINENNLTQRYLDSTRALWLAEAGIAEGMRHLPNDTSGSIGSSGHCYSVDTQLLSADYYQMTSTGTVTSSSGGTITRTVVATIKNVNRTDPTKFQYSIETTVDLVTKGSVDIINDEYPTQLYREFHPINFSDLFVFSKDDVKAMSIVNVLNSVPTEDFSGINWLVLPAGGTLNGNLHGSGILIVEGDIHIAGNVEFDGIIYVIGKLRMSGTPTINGTVLAESDTEVDTTVTGNVTLRYDSDNIIAALDSFDNAFPEIVSWKEG